MSESIENPQIYGLMVKVMGEVGFVEKTGKNQQQNYKFRGIDAVMQALQPALVKHGVIMVPRVMRRDLMEYKTPKGSAMQRVVMDVDYVFYAPDGSHVTASVCGEAADSGDKAVNKAMAAAMKYAVTQTFSIPTEEPKDLEDDSPDLSGGRQAKEPPPKPVQTEQVRNILFDLERLSLIEEFSNLADEVARLGLSDQEKAQLRGPFSKRKHELEAERNELDGTIEPPH